MNRRAAELLAVRRRQEAEARARAPVGGLHFETREVLAATYASDDFTHTLTHAMVVDSDGHELSVACSAVKLMSLADSFAHAKPGGNEAEPTCKTCSAKWRKWKATGEMPELKAPKPTQLEKRILEGEQVTGAKLLEAAAGALPRDEVTPDLMRAFSASGTKACPVSFTARAAPGAGELYPRVQAALRRKYGLTPNAGAYYVWLVRAGTNEPLSNEGPYGPHPLDAADKMARIGARSGIHDRVVSRGDDPQAASFRVERRYASHTGDRLI